MTGPFERHDAFRADGDGHVATEATFDARVEPADAGYLVRIEVPTIDAVVVGERVAEVIVAGWYDTFRRRVVEVDGVTRTAVAEPTVERDGETVTVETTVDGATPAEDARALVQFVEGTWFQGIIPGYEYEPRVQSVRERAHDRGSGAGPDTPI